MVSEVQIRYVDVDAQYSMLLICIDTYHKGVFSYLISYNHYVIFI